MEQAVGSIDSALKLCREALYSAVLCDTLDSFGLHNQSPDNSLKLLDNQTRICGIARVGLYMPIYHDNAELDVYGVEIELIDSLRPNDVPVLVCHGNRRISPWGELLSTRAIFLSAAGCLTDGSVRDVRLIREMGFPVVCADTNPVDTKYRGKMMMFDVPGEIGGVRVESGDLVFADEDGVVFVPSENIIEIVECALEKVHKETTVREELGKGDSLATVFRRHGIL